MKLVKIFIYFISLMLISTIIISLVVKDSLGTEQITTILTYASKEYKIPDNLENFKDTYEYQNLKEEIDNINEFLNKPTTKLIINYLNFINESKNINILFVFLIITIIIQMLVSQKILQVIIINSFNTLITGMFLLIIPTIFARYQSTPILNELFIKFKEYGSYIVIIFVAITLITLTISEKLSKK